MNDLNFLETLTYYFNFSFGARPDISVIFIGLFLTALFLCVLLAKKNRLFYFSKEEPWKAGKDKELLHDGL